MVECIGIAVEDGASVLVGLEGLSVTRVHKDQAGRRVVSLATTQETARACPSCGVLAEHVKEVVTTRPRDLPWPGGPVRLSWTKRRWYCRERCCPRASFTESLPVLPARERLTARLRAEADNTTEAGTTGARYTSNGSTLIGECSIVECLVRRLCPASWAGSVSWQRSHACSSGYGPAAVRGDRGGPS